MYRVLSLNEGSNTISASILSVKERKHISSQMAKYGFTLKVRVQYNFFSLTIEYTELLPFFKSVRDGGYAFPVAKGNDDIIHFVVMTS
jgi:hypothetical protein